MSRYRFSAPRWTSATEIGNPNTARAPEVTAVRESSGQRTAAGWARSGSATGGVGEVGVDARAFAEGVLQILDQVLTSLVVHTEPCGWSSHSNMIPAPVIRMTSAATTHTWRASPDRW